MVWGRARNLIGVHWFNEREESLCNCAANGNHLKLRYPRPDWDPAFPGTCPVCKVLRKDEEQVESVLVRLRAQT